VIKLRDGSGVVSTIRQVNLPAVRRDARPPDAPNRPAIAPGGPISPGTRRRSPTVRVMPSRSPLRATGVALLVAAPLVFSSACALPQSGVPASQSVAVGGGAPLNVDDQVQKTQSATDISTTITSLGTVLTSGGFTLYRNSKDGAKPSKSSCLGKCTATWPPVVSDKPIGTNVIDPSMMGTLKRPDGTEQLTINGWPIYRYAKDLGPGNVTGQGVDGVWTAIGIDGGPMNTAAADTDDPAPDVSAGS
jgi:predicted lipoprotein with Yx(FWY)xxD motif